MADAGGEGPGNWPLDPGLLSQEFFKNNITHFQQSMFWKGHLGVKIGTQTVPGLNAIFMAASQPLSENLDELKCALVVKLRPLKLGCRCN